MINCFSKTYKVRTDFTFFSIGDYGIWLYTMIILSTNINLILLKCSIEAKLHRRFAEILHLSNRWPPHQQKAWKLNHCQNQFISVEVNVIFPVAVLYDLHGITQSEHADLYLSIPTSWMWRLKKKTRNQRHEPLQQMVILIARRHLSMDIVCTINAP